jgi:hypothetical protein
MISKAFLSIAVIMPKLDFSLLRHKIQRSDTPHQRNIHAEKCDAIRVLKKSKPFGVLAGEDVAVLPDQVEREACSAAVFAFSLYFAQFLSRICCSLTRPS